MAFFEEEYVAGTADWEIGRPQEAFARLLRIGEIRGEVLDVGCGTGENALLIAQAGHPTWGVDVSRTAIARASEKAARRRLGVSFRVADALRLSSIGRSFDTVIDCTVFPYFSDEGRRRYVKSLAEVTKPGGRVFLLCYSELEPDWGGARRISEAEIRAAFDYGWLVRSVEPSRIEASDPLITGYAWLATIERVAPPAPSRRPSRRVRPARLPAPRQPRRARRRSPPRSTRRRSK